MQGDASLQSQNDPCGGMEKQKTEKRFPCLECGKAFKRKDGWKNHLKTHTKERSFPCGVCGNAFRLKSHLDRHMIRHTKEKPCICCRCGRAFGHKAILDMHMRVHSKEKPYACGLCGKRFSQQGAMKTHERIHSDERPYSCDKCPLSFKQKSGLTKHVKIHSEEKPFSCAVCDKSFRNRTSLSTHMHVHSKVKSFSCSVCGNSFSMKSNLVIHERGHRQEKPFACNECGKCFSRKDVLGVHLRLHANHKLFSCKECKRCFRLKSSLEKHNIRLHSEDRASLCDGGNSLKNNSDVQSKNLDDSKQNSRNLIPKNETIESDNSTVEKKECNYDFSLKTEASCDDLVTVKEESILCESEFDDKYKNLQSCSSPSDAIANSETQTTKEKNEKGELNTTKSFPAHCETPVKEHKTKVKEVVSDCTTLVNKHIGEPSHLGSGTTQSALHLGEIEGQGTGQIGSGHGCREDHETEEARSSFVAVWTGLV